LRGRKLNVPDVPGLRPTPAKVRQALFNILGDIAGFSVLDLFSGSGLMALEALSRGAKNVVSIEQSRKATEQMRRIREAWGLTGSWRIIPTGVERGLRAVEHEKFDLVFADPPYEQGYLEKVPVWLSDRHIQCGALVVEESGRVQPDWSQGCRSLQTRRYGDTCLHFLEVCRA